MLGNLNVRAGERLAGDVTFMDERGHRLLPDVGPAQVSRELEEFDVERFRRVGAHLDLMWNVAKVCVCP
jgi:hypothetical protein